MLSKLKRLGTRTVAGVLCALLLACARGPVARRAAGPEGGAQGHASEAVFDAPLVAALRDGDDGWARSRRDRSLGVSYEGDAFAAQAWPGVERPSLRDAHRLLLETTPGTRLYLDRQGRGLGGGGYRGYRGHSVVDGPCAW